MNNAQSAPRVQARYRLLDGSWVYYYEDFLCDAIFYFRIQLRRRLINRAKLYSFEYRFDSKGAWLPHLATKVHSLKYDPNAWKWEERKKRKEREARKASGITVLEDAEAAVGR